MREPTLTTGRAFECVVCGESGSLVMESRATNDADGVIRRRRCTHCGFLFTTLEVSLGRRFTAGQADRALARLDAALVKVLNP